MKHRIGFNKLGKNVSHRQALYRSMATALFKYERIKTTKPKAKEIRRVAEKMISRARTDSVHNRRIIGKRIRDKAVLAKLFTDIAPRFQSRPGGYTRILKLGQRYGDASEMVLLELVERAETAPRRRKKETAKAQAEPATEGDQSQEVREEKPVKEAKASKPAETHPGKSGAGSAKAGAARAAAAPGTSAAKPRAKAPAKATAKDSDEGVKDAGAGRSKPAAKAKRNTSVAKSTPAEKAQPAEVEEPKRQAPAGQAPEAEDSEET